MGIPTKTPSSFSGLALPPAIAARPSAVDLALPLTPASTPAQTPCPQSPVAEFDAEFFDFSLPEDAIEHNSDAELKAVTTKIHFQSAKLVYNGVQLAGTLYYIPAEFEGMYERFMDIMPSETPRLGDEGCKPWVLFHEIQGKTWVDQSWLARAGVDVEQRDEQQPRFLAFTDSIEIFMSAAKSLFEDPSLGVIDLQGNFKTSVPPKSANDMIVALPCQKPFLGKRKAVKRFEGFLRPLHEPIHGREYVEVTFWPPAPTSPSTMSLISRITNDAANPKFAARMTGRSFERAYFVANLPTHMRVPPIGGRSEVLSPESLLYPHRGNEAVFKRKQWSNMCYPPSTTDGNVNFKKGVERMPAEYHQVLFVDLQARERVKGSTMLKDVDAKIWELGKGERVEGVEYGDEKAGKGAVSCGGAVEESDGDRMDVD